MREEFVTTVKEYIKIQPDSEQGLAQIKEHVREIGATEEEFTEALRQVVFESIGKRVVKNNAPHELMLLPEEELAERPSHELMIRKDEEIHEGDIDAKFEELRNDIKEHDHKQLTSFQKELASTKEELLQAFEMEMEHQRNVLEKNREEHEAKDPTKQTVHNALISAPRRTVALLLLLVMGIGGIILTSTINKPTQTRSIAASEPKSQTVPQIVPHVFANSEVVNPEKVFSFSPTSVTLVETGIPKREVLGFFPYWMLTDEEQVSLTNLTDMSLFGVEIDGKGNIVTINNSGAPDGGWQMYNDPQLTKLLTRTKAKNIHTSYTLKMFDNTNIENLVRSNSAQTQLIANALHIVSSKNLSGINLDFEYTGEPPADVRDGFTRVVQNLSAELKRQNPGSTLTIDTYISSAADPKLFDLAALAPSVDYFIVMGYDIHTPQGDPGPIAPMESEIGIVGLMQSYLDKISPSQLILAVPYYGYDWSIPKKEGENGTIMTYAEATDQGKLHTIQWDAPAQSPYYTYLDSQTNTAHEVHFENARSLGIKYDYVNTKNLKGIGIWALGYDGNNTDLQSLLIEKFGQK